MLEVGNLQAGYGKSQVLRGIDLQVGRDGPEIVALLGRNGSGRSTAVKAMMGLLQCSGSILLNGVELRGMQTFRIAQQGLGYVPEARDIFPDLSVRQNLDMGIKPGRSERARRPQFTVWSAADMVRLFPRLGERAETPAGLLSGGEQQMLTLCRTLMGNPDVLLIDEPTEGLAPQLVQRIAELLQEVVQRGVSVLLIEQKCDIALKICHRLYVMGQGRIVYEGTAATLAEDRAVSRQWLEV